jgi:monoamine oxidase
MRALAIQQRAEDAIEGASGAHVRGGYDGLPEGLARRFQQAGGRIRTGAAVSAIHWTSGDVRVIFSPVGDTAVAVNATETLKAESVVITLPLGVLQARGVAFDPAPARILEQADRMRMGQVCRINLIFRHRWWAELPHPYRMQLRELSFLLPVRRTPGAHFNVFWTGYPSLDPVITAWSGGPSSAAFAAMTSHEIAHTACADLARAFGLAQKDVLDELVTHHSHDWQKDPYALGAYSWVPVGACDASTRMCEPVDATLFFAGEHTDTTGHWGTVHGAMRSGSRAAQQLLKLTES